MDILPQNHIEIIYDVDEFDENIKRSRITFRDNEAPKVHDLEDEDASFKENKVICHTYCPFACLSDCGNCKKIFFDKLDIKPDEGENEDDENKNFHVKISKKNQNPNSSDITINYELNKIRSNNLRNATDDEDEEENNEEKENLHCPDCSFVSFKEDKFLRHCMTTHNNSNPFQCPSCDEAFPIYLKLLKHLEDLHIESNKIRCKRCCLCMDMKNVTFHVFTCKITRPYECDHCYKSFATNKKKIDHEKRHNVQCPYCEMNFVLLSDYKRHEKSVHMSNKSNKDKIKMKKINTLLTTFESKSQELLKALPDYCSEEPSDKESSVFSEEDTEEEFFHSINQKGDEKIDDANHNKLIEEDATLDLSPETVQMSETDDEPLYHPRNVHKKKKFNKLKRQGQDKVKRHHYNTRKVCLFCKKILHNIPMLKSHCRRIHKTRIILECYSCDERFSSSRGRRQHLRKEHRIWDSTKILCKLCNNYIKTERNMNYHLLYCTQQNRRLNKNNCEMYQKMHNVKSIKDKYNRKNEFVKNDESFKDESVRILSGDETEYVNESNLKSKKVTNITEDKQIQNDENCKKYEKALKICIYCPRKYKKLFRLRDHCRRIHNTTLIFECYTCDARFTSVLQRQRHLSKKHRSIIKFFCKLCKNYIRSEKQMKFHLVECTSRHKYLDNDAVIRYDLNDDPEDSVKCEKCNKNFRSKYALSVHEIRHHKSKDEDAFSNGNELVVVKSEVIADDFTKDQNNFLLNENVHPVFNADVEMANTDLFLNENVNDGTNFYEHANLNDDENLNDYHNSNEEENIFDLNADIEMINDGLYLNEDENLNKNLNFIEDFNNLNDNDNLNKDTNHVKYDDTFNGDDLNEDVNNLNYEDNFNDDNVDDEVNLIDAICLNDKNLNCNDNLNEGNALNYPANLQSENIRLKNNDPPSLKSENIHLKNAIQKQFKNIINKDLRIISIENPINLQFEHDNLKNNDDPPSLKPQNISLKNNDIEAKLNPFKSITNKNIKITSIANLGSQNLQAENIYLKNNDTPSLKRSLHSKNEIEETEKDIKLPEIPKICLYCAKLCFNGHALVTHCKKEHNTSILYECYSCHERFNSVSDRKRHLIDIHGSGQKILCKICKNYILGQREMNIHILHCTNRDKPKYLLNQKNSLICQICKVNFQSEYSLSLHNVLHHQSKDDKIDNNVNNKINDYPSSSNENELLAIKPEEIYDDEDQHYLNRTDILSGEETEFLDATENELLAIKREEIYDDENEHYLNRTDILSGEETELLDATEKNNRRKNHRLNLKRKSEKNDKYIKSKKPNNRRYRNSAPKLCLYCSEVCPDSQTLISHCKLIHNTTTRHECFSCNKRFHTVEERRHHLKSNHGSYYRILCKICNQILRSEKKMNIHFFTCAQKSLTNKNTKDYLKCEECNVKFESSFSLSLHMNLSHQSTDKKTLDIISCDDDSIFLISEEENLEDLNDIQQIEEDIEQNKNIKQQNVKQIKKDINPNPHLNEINKKIKSNRNDLEDWAPSGYISNELEETKKYTRSQLTNIQKFYQYKLKPCSVVLKDILQEDDDNLSESSYSDELPFDDNNFENNSSSRNYCRSTTNSSLDTNASSLMIKVTFKSSSQDSTSISRHEQDIGNHRQVIIEQNCQSSNCGLQNEFVRKENLVQESVDVSIGNDFKDRPIEKETEIEISGENNVDVSEQRVDNKDTNSLPSSSKWGLEETGTQCPCCFRKFANYANLVQHRLMFHKVLNPFSCNSCFKQFTTEYDKMNHMCENIGRV